MTNACKRKGKGSTRRVRLFWAAVCCMAVVLGSSVLLSRAAINIMADVGGDGHAVTFMLNGEYVNGSTADIVITVPHGDGVGGRHTHY